MTVKQILEDIGKTHNVEENCFFQETLKTYLFQLQILKNLKKEIKKSGVLVTKQYVKGTENLYSNPAIADFNKTATAANQTVATLIKIIKSFGTADLSEDEDALLQALNVNGIK